MNVSELKERLEEFDYTDSVIFENPDFADAVVGVSDEGNVIYDFNLMVESLAKEYMENDPNLDLERAEESAIEWIDYNTIRSIPYIHEGVPPIIMYSDFLA